MPFPLSLVAPGGLDGAPGPAIRSRGAKAADL